MTIDTILFDMDGVLIDAREWHYESLNRALAIFGFSISRHDHLETYDGLPTKSKLAMLSKHGNLPTALHGFINQLKQSYTMELIQQKCRPVFHHQYALSRLKAEGYRIAVCSNSIRSTIESMLGRAALLDHIDFFLSNEDVTRSKPDPEIYLSAMQRFGAAPGSCLIVEDNPNGIKAAIASGGHCLKVRDPGDVTYNRIKSEIQAVEAGRAA